MLEYCAICWHSSVLGWYNLFSNYCVSTRVPRATCSRLLVTIDQHPRNKCLWFDATYIVCKFILKKLIRILSPKTSRSSLLIFHQNVFLNKVHVLICKTRLLKSTSTINFQWFSFVEMFKLQKIKSMCCKYQFEVHAQNNFKNAAYNKLNKRVKISQMNMVQSFTSADEEETSILPSPVTVTFVCVWVAFFLSTLLPYLDSYFAASSFAVKLLRLIGLSLPEEPGDPSLPRRANTLAPETLPSVITIVWWMIFKTRQLKIIEDMTIY